jgi:hypothetical protein
MQIQMQAFGRRTKGQSRSLRQIIARDLERRPHPVLYVQAHKSPERVPGWTKLRGKGLPGAINMRWDAASRMLTARAIAKRGNMPHELLGTFLAYLFERHGRRVASVNIQLR